MILSEKLTHLRKEKGLSQLKLAERMDVSRQAVSRWETGAAVPSLQNLRTLGELYGVPLDYLLNDAATEPGQGKETTMTKKTPWQNYLLAAVLGAALPVLAFWLKLSLGGNVSIQLGTLCAGCALALAVCGVLLWRRKAGTVWAGAAAALMLWLLLPGDLALSAALLGAGGVGHLGAIPAMAGALSAVPERLAGCVRRPA